MHIGSLLLKKYIYIYIYFKNKSSYVVLVYFALSKQKQFVIIVLFEINTVVKMRNIVSMARKTSCYANHLNST